MTSEKSPYAERRSGELLKELARAQGARNDLTSSNDATKSAYAEALERTGTSRQTAAQINAGRTIGGSDRVT